jgi:mono/diheme cytochrome c family protein
VDLKALALLTGIAVSTPIARADVTGSYAGNFRTGRPPQTTDAAAVLTDASGALSGTLVLDLGEPVLDGAYLVQGKRKGKHVRLRGLTPTGAQVVLRGTTTTNAVTGKLRVRMAKTHVKGRLTLARLPGGGDGSSCDQVFVDNEPFFTTEVMEGVLVPVCAACHVAGGQAAATRLRVVAGDAAATARTTTLVIDQTTPADSLLLAKPLARLPHGGGQQLAEGSPAAQALEQWATLVAQAECSPSTPTTGPELYTAHCAGCHGSDAAGLDGRPDVRCTVPGWLTDAVRQGRGDGETAMPALSTTQLSADQLGLIADYLGSLCSGSGADLYASNCATCHGATAGGGRSADGVRGPDIRCQDTGDFDEKLAQGEEQMPAFPSLAGAPATKLANFVHGFCTD